ncbi:hypothetical protein FD17_GL002029 [Lentilactobacillus sunkii DSM 19904]|uniref:Uncharacterized protein n=1 Tax=Lentilactobacillus sunkii DSM 19904 TaxID=1423808 RepID=A0A0R1L2H4_9LACO|nr:hypothetical protein FD17_GL002029 [Lentilactobacillus sunkii DSM 19904]
MRKLQQEALLQLRQINLKQVKLIHHQLLLPRLQMRRVHLIKPKLNLNQLLQAQIRPQLKHLTQQQIPQQIHKLLQLTIRMSRQTVTVQFLSLNSRTSVRQMHTTLLCHEPQLSRVHRQKGTFRRQFHQQVIRKQHIINMLNRTPLQQLDRHLTARQTAARLQRLLPQIQRTQIQRIKAVKLRRLLQLHKQIPLEQ